MKTVSGYTMLLTILVIFLNAGNAHAALRHRYDFNIDASAGGQFNDLVGNADGVLYGNAAVSGGQLQLPGAGAGREGDHARLLANGVGGIFIDNYTNATFELWATTDINDQWSRYFDFGGPSNFSPSGAGNSIFLTPEAGGSNRLKVFISNVDIDTQVGIAGEQVAGTNMNLPVGIEHHIVVSFDGQNNLMQLFLDGSLVAQNTNTTNMLELLQTDFALLGGSLYPDPSLDGRINEFRIYDDSFNLADVQLSRAAGPNAVIPEPSAAGLAGVAILCGLGLRRRAAVGAATQIGKLL